MTTTGADRPRHRRHRARGRRHGHRGRRAAPRPGQRLSARHARGRASPPAAPRPAPRRRGRPARGRRLARDGGPGRTERLPLRGHRHRRRRSTASRPRCGAVTPSSRSRVDEGHEVLVEGYSGRALPALPRRRHRRAQPPLPRHLRERRPEGQGRRPRPRPRTDAEPTRVGGGRRRRHLRVARPPDPLDAGRPARAWRAASASSGAYDPWRVPIEVDGTAATIEGTLTYEETHRRRCRGSRSVLVVRRRAGLVRTEPGRRLGAGRARGRVRCSPSWSAGPTTRRPHGGGNPLLWVLPRGRAGGRWCVGLVPAAAPLRAGRHPRLGRLALGLGPVPPRRPDQAGAADRPPVALDRATTAARARRRRGRGLPRGDQRSASSSPSSRTTSRAAYSQPTCLKRR